MSRYEVRARVRTVGPTGFEFEVCPLVYLPFKTKFFASIHARSMTDMASEGLEFYVHDRKTQRDLF